MENEALILEKLNKLEADLKPLIESHNRIQELKADLTPLGNQATALLINELLEVDAGFDLKDLLQLIKQMMRSTKNFKYILKQMGILIDFMQDLEPLLKSAVPQLICYLDELEKRGILRIIKSTLNVRAKVASVYDHEDIERIGDGFVALLALTQKFSDPKTIKFLEKLLTIPEQIDLEHCESVGPGGLIMAGLKRENQDGFGVMLEMTRALGKMKQAS